MSATYEDWKRAVDKELGGAPFDKKLVTRTPEGIALAPLYCEAPAIQVPTRNAEERFRVCTRWGADASAAALQQDLDDGADALWLTEIPPGLALPAGALVVVDGSGAAGTSRSVDGSGEIAPNEAHVLRAFDPMQDARFDFAPALQLARAHSSSVVISSLAHNLAGADAAAELALMLSTAALYFAEFDKAGIAPSAAATQMHLRVAIGADTFGELCKVRALRWLWQKMVSAMKVQNTPITIHAVGAERTLSARDPWVNMLRATTQVFAAVLGGADLVTASAFDARLESPGEIGKRLARNTGLVLREESMLGMVRDPAAGSYYLDHRTNALARLAWQRFQEIQREGGILALRESGALAARLEASWQARLAALRTRKSPVLGVSEFANTGEQLPSPPRPTTAHYDAEPFETLRARTPADAEVLLFTLGSFAESRPRAGFAANFFATAGLRAEESTEPRGAPLVCVCGTDERYLAELVDVARTLKDAGCKRIVVAGRPGEHEAAWRAAGVDDFVYVGCDALTSLTHALEVFA